MNTVWRNFSTALTFLTIIPLPLRGKNITGCGELAAAAGYFPLVGALLGLIFGGIVFIGRLFLPTAPLIGLIFIANFILTRGLHIDGLSDTADGLVGGMEKERSLEIMRDSVIGAMGASAVMFLYAFKFGALLAIKTSVLPLVVFCLPFCGRWAMVFSGSLFGAARKEGLGRQFIEGLGFRQLFGAALIVTIVAAGFFYFAGSFLPQFLSGFCSATIISVLFAAWAARRLNGLTGDLLGAIDELAEAALLFGVFLC
ncbi:MAG: adenosylcobinamide-GDP ribazoletransferase [Firmicutes bacterium]|nr:adenosylcobinamide-GDP ribazoletransferase [Bacillota bacterium]